MVDGVWGIIVRGVCSCGIEDRVFAPRYGEPQKNNDDVAIACGCWLANRGEGVENGVEPTEPAPKGCSIGEVGGEAEGEEGSEPDPGCR